MIPNNPDQDVRFTFNKNVSDKPLEISRSHNTETPAGGVPRIPSPSLRDQLPCWMDPSKGIRQVKAEMSSISLRSITGL